MTDETSVASLLSEPCICLNLKATDKPGVLAEMVDILDRAGKLRDRSAFLTAITAREETGSTGLEQGVAIPHARSDSVRESAVVFAIAPQGIEFGALDGQPSRLFLMIAEPTTGEGKHLELLAEACSHLNEPDVRRQLLAATAPAEVMRLFATMVQPASTESNGDQSPLVIAAVTSCPAGISHTYLAAERLRAAAQRMGVKLLVETRGAVGVKGKLSAEDIAAASAVILAVDRKLDAQRFAGKPLVETWVTDAIRDPEKLIRRALALQAGRPDPVSANRFRRIASLLAANLYRHVMGGVAILLPFVIAGGFMLSLARLLPIDSRNEPVAWLDSAVAWLALVGGTEGAFGLLVPVLAGFIGRSVAGDIGLMPAMVAGMMMAQAPAGLLGGIVAGLLGGYSMEALKWLLRLPAREFETLKAILLYPLLGLGLCAAATWLLIPPMAALNGSISGWLATLTTPESLMLGAVLGVMMAVDLGGPINKIAYTFGIVAIGMGNFGPAAATMAAGMVPPLALGLATTVFIRRYTETERALGRAAFTKGACFVTEGVIPFVVDEPWRVMLPCCLGATLAGALSMAFGCELLMPHGGLLVVPLVANWPQYCLALASGVVLAGTLIGLLKKTSATRGVGS